MLSIATWLVATCLVAPSWQATNRIYTINKDNWLTNMTLISRVKSSSDGYTHWANLEEALTGGNLGDGKGMTIKPDSTNKYNTSADGRPGIIIQAKEELGRESGTLVVDIAHVPEPACGMDAMISLHGNRAENHAHPQIILSELIGWDPSNMMTVYDGTKVGKPRIHKKPGNESFAGYANKRGGVVFVAKWNKTEAQIWDLEGDDIKKFFPDRTRPVDSIDVSKFPNSPNSNWNSKAAGNFKFDLPGPTLKPVLSVSFCDPNVLSAWDYEAPQDAKLKREFPNTCKPLKMSCKEMVGSRPHDFRDVFWDINYIAMYSN